METTPFTKTNFFTYITARLHWCNSKTIQLLFQEYLIAIYTQITFQQEEKFTMYTLYNLTHWPLYICEKMTSLPSTTTCEQFVSLIRSVYTINTRELSNTVFDLIDYDSDGFINVDDAKIFFICFHMEDNDYKTEKMLYGVISSFFGDKYSIEKGEFQYKSTNGNGDILGLFQLFMVKYCFFSKKVLEVYEKCICGKKVKTKSKSKVSRSALYNVTKAFVEYAGVVVGGEVNEEDNDGNVSRRSYNANSNSNSNTNNDGLSDNIDYEDDEALNDEEELSELRNFEMEIRNCIDEIGKNNKRQNKFIKAGTSSFFHSSFSDSHNINNGSTNSNSNSSNTTTTTTLLHPSPIINTINSSKLSKSPNKFLSLPSSLLGRSSTSSSSASNPLPLPFLSNNEFIFLLKEKYYDTLDMIEQERKSKPSQPLQTYNIPSINDIEINKSITAYPSSFQHSATSSSTDNSTKKIQFIKTKAVLVKNHLFLKMFPKEKRKGEKKKQLNIMLCISKHSSYINISKSKFKYFPNIKFTITINTSFNNKKITETLYSEDEATTNRFVQVFKTHIQNDMFLTNISDAYVIGDEIGRGKFGVVKKATAITNNALIYAVKIIDKDTYSEYSTYEISEWERYIFLFLTKVNHPNVIKAIHLYENETQVYYVYEYMRNCDLKTYLNKHHKTISHLNIAAQIINGVNCLHNYGIFHRDIKPTNVLVNADGDVKLADFGLSKVIGVSDCASKQCGSLPYKAPELLMGKKYNMKADVWSLGATLYYVKYNKVLFSNASKEKVKEMIIGYNGYKCGDKGDVLEMIIEECLNKNVKERLSVAKIFKKYIDVY